MHTPADPLGPALGPGLAGARRRIRRVVRDVDEGEARWSHHDVERRLHGLVEGLGRRPGGRPGGVAEEDRLDDSRERRHLGSIDPRVDPHLGRDRVPVVGIVLALGRHLVPEPGRSEIVDGLGCGGLRRMTAESARVPDDRRSLDRDRGQLGIDQRCAVGDVVGEDICARQDGQVDPAPDRVLALDAIGDGGRIGHQAHRPRPGQARRVGHEGDRPDRLAKELGVVRVLRRVEVDQPLQPRRRVRRGVDDAVQRIRQVGRYLGAVARAAGPTGLDAPNSTPLPPSTSATKAIRASVGKTVAVGSDGPPARRSDAARVAPGVVPAAAQAAMSALIGAPPPAAVNASRSAPFVPPPPARSRARLRTWRRRSRTADGLPVTAVMGAASDGRTRVSMPSVARSSTAC